MTVQNLLCRQCDPNKPIFGLQSPQLSKKKEMFKPFPQGVPFVQVLHVNSNHWVTVSNIWPKNDSVFPNSVCIYDSRWSCDMKPSAHTMQQICSFFKCRSFSLNFDYVSVGLQDNSYDCGAYALAFATELAHMKDPALRVFDAKQMRQHIVSSMDSGHILPFPKLRCRKIGFGKRVGAAHTETLYCLCRMPDDGTKYIECLQCVKWYHIKCVSLTTKGSYENISYCFKVHYNGIVFYIRFF